MVAEGAGSQPAWWTRLGARVPVFSPGSSEQTPPPSGQEPACRLGTNHPCLPMRPGTRRAKSPGPRHAHVGRRCGESSAGPGPCTHR